MIKVLIVDDSAFIRTTLTSILEKDEEIKVVATARNGEEALTCISKYDPDVITLDIEMPKMDGLTALKHIMKDMPRPVLMISSLTSEGAEETLKALELGAADFIQKQRIPDESYSNQVREQIHSLAKGNRKRFSLLSRLLRKTGEYTKKIEVHPETTSSFSTCQIGSTIPKAETRFKSVTEPFIKLNFTTVSSEVKSICNSGALSSRVTNTALVNTGSEDFSLAVLPEGEKLIRSIVVIGVSTGGPPVVQKILSSLPENFPACILIAQHMPAAFTGPFAKRLDSASRIKVKEAETGDKILPGIAYISPGGKHLTVRSNMEIIISTEPSTALYKPSVTELFTSVGSVFPRKTLGVMLTGMGSDGLEGAKVLKNAGGKLLAQSEKTCVVYGMPKAVVDANLADMIVDVDKLANAICLSLYR